MLIKLQGDDYHEDGGKTRSFEPLRGQSVQNCLFRRKIDRRCDEPISHRREAKDCDEAVRLAFYACIEE